MVGERTCRLEITGPSTQFLEVYLLADVQRSRRGLRPKFLRYERKGARGIGIRQLDALEWRRR
jgi:hypothetical protein